MTVVCELCGSAIRKRRVLDYDSDPRWWCECTNNACRHAGYDMGSDRDAVMRRLRRERERQLTTVSGYHAYPEPPDDSLCPFCATGPCNVMCEPPADDRAYLAAWRDGEFDDELVGYSEALGYTLTERLMSGE